MYRALFLMCVSLAGLSVPDNGISQEYQFILNGWF